MLWFFFKMVMCIFGEKGMMGNLDMLIGSEYFFQKKYLEVIIDLKKKKIVVIYCGECISEV